MLLGTTSAVFTLDGGALTFTATIKDISSINDVNSFTMLWTLQNGKVKTSYRFPTNRNYD